MRLFGKKPKLDLHPDIVDRAAALHGGEKLRNLTMTTEQHGLYEGGPKAVVEYALIDCAKPETTVGDAKDQARGALSALNDKYVTKAARTLGESPSMTDKELEEFLNELREFFQSVQALS
ncbi:hypothetical protein JNK13_00940 [bacterium]|nr:hypothetical protein [bacterium]